MRWRISGGGWWLSAAAVSLAEQLDEAWPNRHGADGTVGDQAHRARRSDHNPKPGTGEVRALDVGVIRDQGPFLVAELVKSKDGRIKYITHNRTIWRNYEKNGNPPWLPLPYTGPNPHVTHVHVSFKDAQPAGRFAISLGSTDAGGQDMYRAVKHGDGFGRPGGDPAVIVWQDLLAALGEDLGTFGPNADGKDGKYGNTVKGIVARRTGTDGMMIGPVEGAKIIAAIHSANGNTAALESLIRQLETKVDGHVADVQSSTPHS